MRSGISDISDGPAGNRALGNETWVHYTYGSGHAAEVPPIM